LTHSVFFVIGAAKSGTSSLYHYLKAHPDIHMCPNKDVACYFCRDYGMPLTFQEYKALLLPEGDYLAAGDCCHAYLTDEKSSEWIRSKFSTAKIIVILRNPIEKAFSQYHWMVSHGYEFIESFEAAIKEEKNRILRNPWKDQRLTQGYPPNYLYMHSSMYARQIKRYKKSFPDDQLLFLTYDELRSSPAAMMKKIYNFLGVKDTIKFPLFNAFNKRQDVYSIRLQYFLRNRLMRILPWFIVRLLMKLNTKDGADLMLSKSARDQLIKIFEDDIERTAKLTGLDLDPWLQHN